MRALPLPALLLVACATVDDSTTFSARAPAPAADRTRSAGVRQGDEYMRARRFRDAAQMYLEASEENPADLEATFKLGNALAVLGLYDEAVKCWEHVRRETADQRVANDAAANIRRARGKIRAHREAEPPPVFDDDEEQSAPAFSGGLRRRHGSAGGDVPSICNCHGYDGPGGPCYAGPGGPAYSGPGGPAYDGPGGPCYAGPGGPAYAGPGGPAYSGPGGPAYRGPGGPAYDGPGGPAYDGPGGPCYAGAGGPCYSGPGGDGRDCPAVCR